MVVELAHTTSQLPRVSRVRCGGLGFVSMILAFLNRPQTISTAFLVLNSVTRVASGLPPRIFNFL